MDAQRWALSAEARGHAAAGYEAAFDKLAALLA
jgi:hypothetical protein